MGRHDDSSGKHFLSLLSEGLLEMNRYGSVGCLFGCNGWIYMNMIWLTWELAYAFKEFWVLSLNLLLCLHDSYFLQCVFLGILDLEVGRMDAEFSCCRDVDCA